MNQTLKKFIPRAPRYVLRPSDSQVLNFKHENEAGNKHHTKIINVSSTGIAFLVEKSDAPLIGELIKIEFPIPGGEQMAWWAKVVRMESYSDNRWWDGKDSFDSPKHVLVGLSYVDLPEGHRKAIQLGLQSRYKELKRQYYQEWLNDFKEFILRNFWNFILFALCIFASIMALTLFTHYEPLFDRKNGSIYYEMFEGWDF